MVDERLFEKLCSYLEQHRMDSLTTDEILRFLHACGKLGFRSRRDGLLQRMLTKLKVERVVQRLVVFDALRLSDALGKIGLEFFELETHVSNILPNEAKKGRSQRGSAVGETVKNAQQHRARLIMKGGLDHRETSFEKKTRKSARKQKWTW